MYCLGKFFCSGDFDLDDNLCYVFSAFDCSNY